MSSPLLDRRKVLDSLLRICSDASQVILRIDAAGFEVGYKEGDDPVTLADREANDLICAELGRRFPSIPIVAEESDPASYAGFEASPATFFVDPLDGTRDFVARNGEFSVMIGLAEAGRATVGVVHCPALDVIYAGAEGVGAFKITNGSRHTMFASQISSFANASAMISRSHRSSRLDAIFAELGIRTINPFGSMGIKGGKVAAAEADLYVQPGIAGKRWDSCAPDAIIRAAGGVASDMLGRPINYASSELDNVSGLVVTNQALHAPVIAAVRHLLIT